MLCWKLLGFFGVLQLLAARHVGGLKRVHVNGANSSEALLKDSERAMISASVPPPSSRWYHGKLDRTIAEERLRQARNPGSYLIRESDRRPGSFVLSFLSMTNVVNHFRYGRHICSVPVRNVPTGAVTKPSWIWQQLTLK